jgi:hypothetical protein
MRTISYRYHRRISAWPMHDTLSSQVPQEASGRCGCEDETHPVSFQADESCSVLTFVIVMCGLDGLL